MTEILFLLKVLALFSPFILLALLSNKANLKKQERSRQCYMPIVAIVFCITTGVFLTPIASGVVHIINEIPVWITNFADWLGSLFGGALSGISTWLRALMEKFADFLETLDLTFWVGILVNSIIIGAYVPLKTATARFMKLFCKDGKPRYERFAGLVYYKDERRGRWFVKETFTQGVTLLKVLYITALILAPIGVCVTAFLLKNGIIASFYYPVFSVIMLGELYFFFDGEFAEREETSLEGEADRASGVYDYTLMRNVLRRTFGDKLLGENTTVNNGLLYYRTNDELLGLLEDDEKASIEAYGKFMRMKTEGGLDLDQNYLMSGLDLLQGKSILFNNPFYYDLIPYVFYPMNRTILRRKKVLIVLGRHAIEGEIEEWCRKGLAAVNHMPDLWSVGVLGKEESNPDVGIVTRSQVHDLEMHEVNDAFFSEVEFVMLVEPSKLIATAQIGLNSLVRHCRRDGKRLVFCSADKNCDGIVDALSHILMTSLEEVSATNRHGGTSSYMCWEVDDEHLQHRMLPNLSRYLGMGTELSFSALKNQISKTYWYGGEAFPVLDMHWIVKQYHFDLLNYAALPAQQTMVDEVFKATPNMWDASVEDYKYLTVEDENYNMFEVQREFSTRAKKQGFINVISSDYLLKDYMAANDTIFHADSKAIPYIVADYAGTERNIIYRICLRLSSYKVTEDEIARELSLIGMDISDIASTLWKSICKCSQSTGIATVNGESELHITKNGKEYVFGPSVIEMTRKYSFKSGDMENFYTISDKQFVDIFLGDLCSAEYIAEDEKGEKQYLGSELRGHVFQKYLPGQFFTFGGKYYEMLRLSSDGKVVVRRAADHINGRPQYRQVRDYTIRSLTDTGMMGDSREIGGVKVSKQFADLLVDTPAYWTMRRYNDFADGRLVTINGVPQREYRNKQVLSIDFGDKASPAVIRTITLLINEIFRTLYADNQGMIVAVCAGDIDAPLTYSLKGEGDFTPSESTVYIIEDSQLDVGLLVSVERNIDRIFAIMCDYLKWHGETYAESIAPPEPEPEKPDYTQPEDAPKEKKGIRKIISKVGSFFKKIGSFFKNLFKRKKKGDPDAEQPSGETNGETEGVAAEGEEKPKKKGIFSKLKGAFKRKPKKDKDAAGSATLSEEDFAEAEDGVTEVAETEGAENGAETEEGAEETAEEAAVEDEETVEEAETEGEEAAEAVAEVAEDEVSAESEEVAEEAEEEEQISESRMFFNAEEGAEAPEADLEFEPDEGEKAGGESVEYSRKPYHERFYLLYGFESVPECLDTDATLELLVQLRYDNSFLEQARNGKDEAERLEKSFDPSRGAGHYCDFCGVELLGTEYEVLSDGRERCMNCGRTAVKTEEEFRKLYDDVIRNLKVFYGVVINEPIQVKMVNAKKLHSRLGKQFVPTGKSDGRVLGVAIKDKSGYSILLENGSPRISATMTMAHELTHIWQYLNWDAKAIRKLYGKDLELQIYEGMAKWSEIQYAYLINEKITGKREEILTYLREDEYGEGFKKYVSVYPLSTTVKLEGDSPFNNPAKPL